MTSETAGRFDVIVIGAGPAGEVVAGRLASAGLATAVVEREFVGGECSYFACIPTTGSVVRQFVVVHRDSGCVEKKQVPNWLVAVSVLCLTAARLVRGLETAVPGPLQIAAPRAAPSASGTVGKHPLAGRETMLDTTVQDGHGLGKKSARSWHRRSNVASLDP